MTSRDLNVFSLRLSTQAADVRGVIATRVATRTPHTCPPRKGVELNCLFMVLFNVGARLIMSCTATKYNRLFIFVVITPSRWQMYRFKMADVRAPCAPQVRMCCLPRSVRFLSCLDTDNARNRKVFVPTDPRTAPIYRLTHPLSMFRNTLIYK